MTNGLAFQQKGRRIIDSLKKMFFRKSTVCLYTVLSLRDWLFDLVLLVSSCKFDQNILFLLSSTDCGFETSIEKRNEWMFIWMFICYFNQMFSDQCSPNPFVCVMIWFCFRFCNFLLFMFFVFVLSVDLRSVANANAM